MADQKISQLADAGAPQDTDQLVLARAGTTLSLLFSSLKAAIPGGVTSVFGRTGAVTAQSGDYTAAQVGALPSTNSISDIAAANATGANWSNNSKKITSLANGAAASDAAAFGQIPTALPPNGSAGGDLTGSYPNPTLAAAGPGATGPIGDATHTPAVTIDAKGRVTGLTSVAIDLPGHPVLIYRYTVTGSDKASIDTGVDTPDAGSNDWTGGDLIEVFMYARTDEAVGASALAFTLNNDTGATQYDFVRIRNLNATVTGTNSIGRANWLGEAAGASATANVFGTTRINIPNFAGTTGFKAGELTTHVPDQTAANTVVDVYGVSYRSTSAVTRLAVTPATAAKKLKVGSQLLIYKRLSA